jgi:peptidyl-tRNA hydrolase
VNSGLDPEDRLADTVDEWRRRWRERVIDHERERDQPWALPLVVRVERGAMPTHEAALHAAATSVVALLTHADAAGPWQPALARWSDGRIRKVVRRARASRWEEVNALPGVTASRGGAEVRALLPHPVADPPPALARLRITGLDLPKDPAAADAASASPLLTIATAPDLTLTTGKACAQVGHAAQLALLQLDRATVLAWVGAGHPLRVVEASPAEWDRLRQADRDVALVQDGGFTEVAPGTHTSAATFVA